MRAGSGEILEPPSEAELAVLRLLASDLSAREIGAKLFLSPNTVRSHMRRIYRKLGVNSRAEAVARADALGARANGITQVICHVSPALGTLRAMLEAWQIGCTDSRSKVSSATVRAMHSRAWLSHARGEDGPGRSRP
jgi:DNA-binding CsgD family transcriptional regulator